MPTPFTSLQNYVIGPAPDGLVLASDGSLDIERSFQKVNYFPRLAALAVKNNVQADVGSHPVDFIAVRIPKAAVAQDEDAVWLYASEDRQAIIHSRHDASGNLELRYLPVRGLQQDADGKIHFDTAELVAGLPLRIWEDPDFRVPHDERSAWLSAWHSEVEWLHAVHKTKYSDGIIALHEQFLACAPNRRRCISGQEIPGAQAALSRTGLPDLCQRSLELQRARIQSGRKSRLTAAHLHPFGADVGRWRGNRDSTRVG